MDHWIIFHQESGKKWKWGEGGEEGEKNKKINEKKERKEKSIFILSKLSLWRGLMYIESNRSFQGSDNWLSIPINILSNKSYLFDLGYPSWKEKEELENFLFFPEYFMKSWILRVNQYVSGRYPQYFLILYHYNRIIARLKERFIVLFFTENELGCTWVHNNNIIHKKVLFVVVESNKEFFVCFYFIIISFFLCEAHNRITNNAHFLE